MITTIAFPRVAVVGPFSGPRAAWGELLTASMAGAGATRVDFETFDDQGDPEIALECGRRIVAAGEYAAVIGHFNSGGAAAALPLYRDAGLPAVFPLSTRPGLLESGSGYGLRTCPTDAAQAAFITRELQGRLTVLDDGSAYGHEVANHFRSRAGANAVVVCGKLAGVAAIVNQLGAIGYAGTVVVTDDCAVPAFARMTPERPRNTLVCEMTGSPLGRVAEAFAATVGALDCAPWLTGQALVAEIRARLRRPLDAAGELVASAADWTLINVDALEGI